MFPKMRLLSLCAIYGDDPPGELAHKSTALYLTTLSHGITYKRENEITSLPHLKLSKITMLVVVLGYFN